MSDRVRDINAALVDSNRIKDRYVCQYVDLSVYYISRLDDLRRMICRQAKTESPEALIRRLSLPQNSLRQEFAEFYRRFDASFLEIFPRFIEQVDALLLPEARIEPFAALPHHRTAHPRRNPPGHHRQRPYRPLPELRADDRLYLPHQTPQHGPRQGGIRGANPPDRAVRCRRASI